MSTQFMIYFYIFLYLKKLYIYSIYIMHLPMPSPVFVAFDHRVQWCTRDFQLLTFASCTDKTILSELHKFLYHLTHITSVSEYIRHIFGHLGKNIWKKIRHQKYPRYFAISKHKSFPWCDKSQLCKLRII